MHDSVVLKDNANGIASAHTIAGWNVTNDVSITDIIL